MEPLTLTASAIATLAFQKFLESGAGELGKKFTTEAIAKMDQLRQLIWQKMQGKPTAETALKQVEQGDPAELDRLVAYLQVSMDDDPDFAQQVQQLAYEINIGKIQDNSSQTQINRDNAKGWQTRVEGGTAYIGEIHIQGKPE
jgi:hypothetical protein